MSNTNVFMLIGFIVLATACSTHATIAVADGSTVEGRISESNESTVNVDVQGTVVPIERRHIVDVEHPGTPSMVIGGGMSAVGASVAAFGVFYGSEVLGASSREQDVGAGLAIAGGAFTLIGLVPFVWGAMTRIESVEAFEDDRPFVVAPRVSENQLGVNVGLEF